MLRIDNRAAGRELVRRLIPVVDSGRPSSDPAHDAWITVAFTYQGLEALGVPQDSLDSFAPEFRQGMAARASRARRRRREQPRELGAAARLGDVHVAIATISPDAGRLEAVLDRARRGARAATRCRGDLASRLLPAPDRAHLVRLQGRDRAAGRRRQRHRSDEPEGAAAASGRDHPRLPRRNRRPTTDAFTRRTRSKRHIRRLPQTAYASRGIPAIPPARATNRDEEALLGAKMVGRWQSGAPLAVSPETDDPELGADPRRNNDFLYGDDLRGFKCPAGSHARRANPRDALDHEGSVNARLHRMIRRGTSYGPPLPDGVLDDDGADRGIIFVFAGAHLHRQFEFVKTQWINDGIFIGASAEKDPDGRAERRVRHVHDRAAPDSAPAHRHASVRRHPRRRVLLRPRSASTALARRAGHVTSRDTEQGTPMDRRHE